MISKGLLLCVFLPCLWAETIFTTGPDAGLSNVPAINTGYAVTDTFTLTSKVILNQVTFADWPDPGYTAASIDWEITSQPDSGVLFSGTDAAIVSNTFVHTGTAGGQQYSVYNSSFNLPNISLGAGTYWLLLDNCSPADAGAWGLSSNSGTARQYLNGVLDASNFGTESFTLSGSVVVAPTGAPEPSGIFLVGGLLLAAMLVAKSRLHRPQ